MNHEDKAALTEDQPQNPLESSQPESNQQSERPRAGSPTGLRVRTGLRAGDKGGTVID